MVAGSGSPTTPPDHMAAGPGASWPGLVANTTNTTNATRGIGMTDDDVDPFYNALMRSRPGDYGAGPEELVAALLRRPAWHSEAACRGVGPGVFFLGRGGDTRPARALCASCTTTEDCRTASAEELGIWAGTTGRARRPAAGQTPLAHGLA